MESSTLVPSCVLGLFINDSDMIKRYCTADFILTPSLPETAIDIGHGNFFISSMNTSAHWTISCSGRKPRALLSCRSCIIALDCRCNLKTPNSFISASLDNCPDATSSSGLTKTFVPNLTWLQSLPNSSVNYTKIVTQQLADSDPADYIVPYPIPTYDDVASFMEFDKEIRTGLDLIMTQAESQKPIYVSKFQKLSEEAGFLTFRMNHAIPLALAGLAWNAVITFILITLFKRGAPAMFLGSFGKSVTGAPVSPQAATSPQSFCLWYIAILLSAYIVFVLLLKYLKHRKAKRCVGDDHYPVKTHDQISTEVFLKFWTPFRLAVVKIDHILAAQHDLTLATSDTRPKQTVYITYDFRLYNTILLCNWSNNILRHKTLNIQIPLPESVSVPRSVRHCLIQILQKDFQMSLILKTGPDQTEISLTKSLTPSITSRTTYNWWNLLGIRRTPKQTDPYSTPPEFRDTVRAKPKNRFVRTYRPRSWFKKTSSPSNSSKSSPNNSSKESLSSNPSRASAQPKSPTKSIPPMPLLPGPSRPPPTSKTTPSKTTWPCTCKICTYTKPVKSHNPLPTQKEFISQAAGRDWLRAEQLTPTTSNEVYELPQSDIIAEQGSPSMKRDSLMTDLYETAVFRTEQTNPNKPFPKQNKIGKSPRQSPKQSPKRNSRKRNKTNAMGTRPKSPQSPTTYERKSKQTKLSTDSASKLDDIC